jgi:hypothetical protein
MELKRRKTNLYGQDTQAEENDCADGNGPTNCYVWRQSIEIVLVFLKNNGKHK